MAYTVHQAKTNLSRILREVEEGKEVIVMRGKKPVARITAFEQPSVRRRVPGGFEGLVHADDRALEPLTDEQLVEYGFGFMLENGGAGERDEEDQLGQAGPAR